MKLFLLTCKIFPRAVIPPRNIPWWGFGGCGWYKRYWPSLFLPVWSDDEGTEKMWPPFPLAGLALLLLFPPICPFSGECSAIPKTAGGTTTYPWDGKAAETPLSQAGLRMLRQDLVGMEGGEPWGHWHSDRMSLTATPCSLGTPAFPHWIPIQTRGLPQLLPMSSLFCFHIHSPSVLQLQAKAFLPPELPNSFFLSLFLIFFLSVSLCPRHLPEIDVGYWHLCSWQDNFCPLHSGLHPTVWLPHSLCFKALSALPLFQCCSASSEY